MPKQASLKRFERQSEPTADLSDAEREVWDQVENGPYGPREYLAKRDGWNSPGTVSNLLRRAREKMEAT
jgi:DNA-binding CsgD family transcriptional regulator